MSRGSLRRHLRWVLGEHGEVVLAFDDPCFYEQPHGEHEDRMTGVAKTVRGRVLLIAYSDEELPLYRLITAYDAPHMWVEVYNEQR